MKKAYQASPSHESGGSQAHVTIDLTTPPRYKLADKKTVTKTDRHASNNSKKKTAKKGTDADIPKYGSKTNRPPAADYLSGQDQGAVRDKALSIESRQKKSGSRVKSFSQQ